MVPQRLAVVVAVAALCLLPACGSDDASSESAKPASLVLEVPDQSKKFVVFKAPRSVEAGLVRITLKNTGKSIHDAQLVRVDGDHSGEEAADKLLEAPAKAGTPDWLHPAGGFGALAGGRMGKVTKVLEPGTYYVLDTQRGTPKGRSFASEGTIAKIEVTGEGGGELPSTDARITTKEYGFDTAGLEVGRNRLTFENLGEEPHQLVALPLAPQATLAEAKRALTSKGPPKGALPIDQTRLQSAAVLDGGEEQVIEMNLSPGRYVMACFLSDRKGGQPHIEKGMLSELNVGDGDGDGGGGGAPLPSPSPPPSDERQERKPV